MAVNLDSKQIDPTPFSFSQFVHLKGGEFFFAPSIPFLKALSKP